MHFTLIYDRILPLWPPSIKVADGHPTSTAEGIERTSGKIPSDSIGYIFPALSTAFFEIEDQIDHANDTWGSLMAWSMFQVYHSEAIVHFSSGESIIQPALIPRSQVEARFFANLHSEGWEVEKNQYVRL